MRYYRIQGLCFEDVKSIIDRIAIRHAHPFVDKNTGEVMVIMDDVRKDCVEFETRVLTFKLKASGIKFRTGIM